MKTRCASGYVNDFRYSIQAELPPLGMPSRNFKILSEQWEGPRRVTLHGGIQPSSAEGADLSQNGTVLSFTIPESDGYAAHSITLDLPR